MSATRERKRAHTRLIDGAYAADFVCRAAGYPAYELWSKGYEA